MLYLSPSDFPQYFSQAHSYLNRMERLLIQQKLILKFHLKKILTLTQEYIFKNILSAESVKFCFLVTFNIIVSYSFSENVIET